MPRADPVASTSRSGAGSRAGGARSPGLLRGQWDVLAVISAGGVIGSLSRWGVSLTVPHRVGDLPWSTVSVNVVGCLAIGGLMVVVLEVAPPSRYLRPFLGTGVLGGFTTFSTYTLDAVTLVEAGRPAAGAGYLLGSLFGGLVAVWLGAVLVRGAIAVRGRVDRSTSPCRRSE